MMYGSKEYKEGYEAGLRSAPTSNPYNKETEEQQAIDWARGYYEGGLELACEPTWPGDDSGGGPW